MTKIVLTFEGNNWDEIAQSMRQAFPIPSIVPSTSATDFPDEDLSAPKPEFVTGAPDMPAGARGRSHKKKPNSELPTPAEMIKATEPPKPEPELEPETPPIIPSLDVLKAQVTQAVRLAQKKEGPTKILDLLPEFKSSTGLSFVMEAEDRHRPALMNLIAAAGL